MNLASVLIFAIVVAAVVASLRYTLKSTKNGSCMDCPSGKSGHCASCATAEKIARDLEAADKARG